jgi:zinc transport system substrate-binding protein
MKRRFDRRIVPFFLLLLILLSPPASADRLQVFVSILPQQILVERIGGEHVAVSLMVGSGRSPETYEPTPRQMAEVTTARLYYRIGVPFEQVWLPRIREVNPALDLLDARDGIELREMEPEDGHHHDAAPGHAHEGNRDPHIWLSPPLIKIMAGRLRDRLIELDPAHRADYAANCTRFLVDLERLDGAIRTRLQGVTRRDFMVFHPSWGYFADAYGLRQIPIESGGKEPGARTLARLIREAKEKGIRVIFIQRQFSQRQALSLADAIGGTVAVIDPLAPDYPDNLLRVADAIAEAGR